MRLLFSSDLHGREPLYEQLLARAKTERPDALVLGGDLLPNPPGQTLEAHLGAQSRFVHEYLLPWLRQLRAAVPACRCLLIPGNDDFAATLPLLEAEDGRLLHLLHLRSLDLGGYSLAGYSCVPICGGAVQDWERPDTSEHDTPDWFKGFQATLSTPEGAIQKPPPGKPWWSKTLREDLNALSRLSDPSRTIYVVHTPPLNTRLDRVYGAANAGSQAVRDFIERKQPPLTLHGHIHESPIESGFYFDHLGSTLCVNPGQPDAINLGFPVMRPLRLHSALVVVDEETLSVVRHTLLAG